MSENNTVKTRWYKDAVIYQIYPRSYADSNNDGIGDLQGIISKLDYIKSLGVNGIWLSPVYDSPNFDNGYDIRDYYNINPEFGTLEDFKMLSEECKKRDIKIIMDLVVNHTSNEHKWFIESKKGKDNPYSDYYVWKDGKGKDGKKPPNNWNSRFTGPAWSYDENRKQWYLHLFAEQQPDLNWENPKVRKEILDICEFWLNNGVDGFRCDVLTYIAKDQSYADGKFVIGLKGTEKFAMYGPWFDYVKYLNDNSWSKHDSMTVVEGQDATFEQIMRATDENTGVIDTFFDFTHLMTDTHFNYVPKKFDFISFKKILGKWQNLPPNHWNTLFLENHDCIRSTSRFIKNPDYYPVGAKMLAVMMLMQRGTPYIYQGQELGMTNCHFEKDEFKDVMADMIFDTIHKKFPFLMNYALKAMNLRGRDNCRTPMQWDNTKNAGFNDENAPTWLKVNPNKDKINVALEQNDPDSVLNFYKKIIAFRKNDIVKLGSYVDLEPKSKKLFAYKREYNGKGYVVICNFTDKTFNHNIKRYDLSNPVIAMSNYNDSALADTILLRPYEAVIIEYNK